MTCQEFWDSNPEIRQGETNAVLLQHGAECEACATLLNRHRTLEAGLKSLAAQVRHQEAPARVEAGLVAAFRMQNRKVRHSRVSEWWVPVFSWTAAAAVLVMAALMLLRAPESSMPSHRAAPGTVEMASLADQPQDADTSADSEDGFITLPNAATLDPNDDVNVVRVEVPRSAMMAVGLAVSAERITEMVEADVKLGPDGVARAIRFVDE